MADAIHSVLSQFRDSILAAVATLEFRLRDVVQPVSGGSSSAADLAELRSRIEQLEAIRSIQSEEKFKRLEDLIQKMNTGPSILSESPVDETHVRSEIMKITKPTTSNILVPVGVQSVHVHSAAPVPTPIAHSKPVEVIVEEGDEDGASRSEVSSEAQEEPSLEEFEVDGTIYYKDEENAVYSKTGEGEYEQVGQWDPNEETLELFESEEEIEEEEEEKEAAMDVESDSEESEEASEAEAEESEEEELECEEFEYNGVTYLRDTENKVYTQDGEPVGLWTGKRIRPLPTL